MAIDKSKNFLTVFLCGTKTTARFFSSKFQFGILVQFQTDKNKFPVRRDINISRQLFCFCGETVLFK
jgi:hypothetical protein